MPVLLSTSRVRSLPLSRKAISDVAARMLKGVGAPKAELSILLCDDERIHELNRDYRNKDKPTDVLAFAAREADDNNWNKGILGDVVISVDTARRQAAEKGHTIAHEIFFLLAHGLLHLVGYDHQTDEEERVMNAKTEEIVRLATSVKSPEKR